jgi:rod shape-determining protein MreD
MTEKLLPTALSLIVAWILQVSVVPYLSIFGVVPNLLFLVVVALALVEGPEAGCIAGFVAGLIFDLLGSSVVGPYALVLCVVGYVAGMLQANMFAEGWLLPVTVVFVAGLGSELAHGLILVVLDVGVPFWTALLRIMIPGALYNTALAVLLFPLLARVLRRDRTVRAFRRVA